MNARLAQWLSLADIAKNDKSLIANHKAAYLPEIFKKALDENKQLLDEIKDYPQLENMRIEVEKENERLESAILVYA